MVVAIASMKGGVGKSTLCAMIAKFIVEQRGTPVTVVDLDPQRGATILLLGAEYTKHQTGPGVYEILESEQAGIPSAELVWQALKTSPYDSRIRVIPSDASLARLRGPETPRELLGVALRDFAWAPEETVIVDTSPEVTFCEMGIEAAEVVFVPLTMSHQSGVPTLNTMQAVVVAEKAIGGLVPTLVGSAKWQEWRVDSWRTALMESDLLKDYGIQVLPPVPFSHSIPSGKWRWGKLPRSCLPALDAMYASVFGEHALSEAEVACADEVESELAAVEGVAG